MSARPFRFAVQQHQSPDGPTFIEAARRIESLGYDTLHVMDHFGDQLGPLAAMTAAAAATEKLRVGSLVLDNDYRHPLVLAKELATIDLVSGGRLEVGLGAGWMDSDYRESGIPKDRAGIRIDRLEEALIVLKGLWSEEPVTFEGDHYRISGHRGTPTPVQRPHPPAFVSAFSPDTFDLAAEYGCNLFLPAQVIPAEQLRQAIGGFHAALDKHGRNKADHRVPVLLPCYVEPDGASARRNVERSMMSYYDIIGVMMQEMMGRLQRKHAEFPESYKGYLALGDLTKDLNYDFVCKELAIFGSPKEAIDRLQFLKEELGIDDVILWTNVGGMPHDKVTASMKLFAEEVMPHV